MENKGSDEVEKLKTKFLSVWHNVKYSWALKTKTSFSRNSPVLLLGKCYHFKAEDDSSPTEACYEAPDDDFIMGNVEAFRKDFASRVWLTYREEFPPLPSSSLTSDCGWGCMLRAGQMMLAQALILHFMGRDWTWSEALTLQPLDTETRTTTAAKRLVASLEASLQGSPRPSDQGPSTMPQTRAEGSAQEADAHLKEMYHRTLVSWFGDTSAAQLGLHRLVHLGLAMGKQAGDWYGPAVVAHILKKAVEEAMDPALAGITAYVSQDCTDCGAAVSGDMNFNCLIPNKHIRSKSITSQSNLFLTSITRVVIHVGPLYSWSPRVYSADVLDSHRASTAGHVSTERSGAPPLTRNNQQASASTLQDGRAVIILVPVRLGGEKTNPEYFEFAKSILSLEYCIGIIGGKPKQACYFVGFQDDSLIYMDPHYCQSFVDVSTEDFPLQSYHCPSPKKMPFSKMDPSCTIGFYSRSVQDYERITQELSKVLQPTAKDKYPAFTFVEGHGRDYELSAGLTPEKREWPFIHDPKRTVSMAGDFVLL